MAMTQKNLYDHTVEDITYHLIRGDVPEEIGKWDREHV